MENQQNPKLQEASELFKSIILRGEIAFADTSFFFKFPNELASERRNLILQNVNYMKAALDILTKIVTE